MSGLATNTNTISLNHKLIINVKLNGNGRLLSPLSTSGFIMNNFTLTTFITLSLVTIGCGQNLSSLVAGDMGLTIDSIGKLATSNSETLISVILQLPNIQDNLEYYTTGETSRIEQCVKNFQKTGVHHFIPEIVMENLNVDRKKVSSYINSRRQVLKPYIVDVSGKTRTKRGILSILGGSLLTLAFGGIAEYQMHRLKLHIKDNSDRIEVLKDNLRSDQQKILHLRQDLVGLIKADRDSLVSFATTMSCIDLPFILRTNRDNLFSTKSKIIDDVLTGPLEGKNKLALTPKIIGPELLRKVVNQHPQLNSTIFKDNPHLLYSTSTISLLSIDSNLTQAHFVMFIPLVNVKDSLHNLYHTVQVGIHVKDNTCGYFDLPKHLFVKDEKFYNVKLSDCQQNNALYICSIGSIQNVSSCIQKDEITCPLRHTTCISQCHFEVCKQGILFRENSGKYAYTFDKKGYTSEINLKRSHSHFIPWREFSAIQVCNNKLESPSTVHPSLTVANFSMDHDALDIIDPDHISRIFKNLSSHYNTSLQMVMNPIFSNHRENDIIALSRHQWINTILIIILILLIGYIYHHLGLFCNNCFNCRYCGYNCFPCPDNEHPDLESGDKPNFRRHGLIAEVPSTASNNFIGDNAVECSRDAERPQSLDISERPNSVS